MIEQVRSPMEVLAERFVDQVWAIRPSNMQAHLARFAASASTSAARAESGTFERQGAVAVFHVRGVMVPKATWFDEVSTNSLAQALSAAAKDEDIKAGVMLINSPGGMALGQLELAAAAAEFAEGKNLVAHIEGCCCSAAYWLASQATTISCGPRDDVGSIGVRSLIYDWSKFFAEAGVEAVSSATGPFKDLGVMGKEITPEQRAFLQDRVEFIMGDFKSAVRSGRGMSEEEFLAVADGRFWFGEQALDLNLVDVLQSTSQMFAGLESAISRTSVSVGSNPMADEATKKDEPKAVTTAELKKSFPSSTADWREEQIEAGATMTDAAVAYAQFQEQEAEKARTELAEAQEAAEKEKAEQDKKETAGEPAKSKRGVPASKQQPGESEEADGETDFRRMAKDLAKEKGISYRQACRRIQKQHGMEARNAFKSAPLGDM